METGEKFNFLGISIWGAICITFRIESAFERHSKHDAINNCFYNLTLKCLYGNYIVFINRSAAKLYDFVRAVLDFASLSKASLIRIEIYDSPPNHIFIGTK